MRSLVGTASLLAVLSLALPLSAAAQDPPPPPPQAKERQAAAPRAEQAQRAAERVGESQNGAAREPKPAKESRPQESRDSQAAERAGAVRREAARDNAAREVRTAEESSRRRPSIGEAPAMPAAPAATANNDDQAERRGAVRRPPSDGRGGTAGPRDRAVARTGPPPDRDRDRDRDRIYVYPDYWSYGRYYDPYYYGGGHLGYLAYSPWGWTPAFYGSPYDYGYGYGGYGSYQARGYDIGRVRLKVKPRDAEVYVDGYYAGVIDDFDGVLQSLRLDSGGYRIEIRKPGFETLNFDVRVQPDRTITYRGEMKEIP
jgi:hypothetical protein